MRIATASGVLMYTACLNANGIATKIAEGVRPAEPCDDTTRIVRFLWRSIMGGTQRRHGT